MVSRSRRIALKPDFRVSRISEQSLASPVNMYAEAAPGKGPFPLISHPGCGLYTTLTGPIRGQAEIDGVHYVVAGSLLYRMSGTVETSLGTVAGAGPVQIVPNRFEIGIVAAPRLYVLNRETQAFSEVRRTDDNGFPGADWLCCLNGLGVFGESGGDRFNVTGLHAFSDINPTDVATAESRSDPLVIGVVMSGSLFLMGRDTTELWDNTATGDFPLTRSLVIDIGAVSRETVKVIGSEIYFIGRVPADGLGQIGVFRLRGGSPVKVSTPPVDRLLEKSAGDGFIDQSSAVVWGVDGHVFYRVTTSAGSVEFDLTTESWVRVGSGVWLDDQDPLASDLTSFVRVNGRGLFGDATGRLLEVDYGENSIGGDTFVREFTCPTTGELGRVTIIDAVEVECQTGVGQIGRDPVIYEMHSKDGGHVWSMPLAGTVQQLGRYGRRVRWTRLGIARDWIFRFRMTDAAPLKVTGVFADVEPGV